LRDPKLKNIPASIRQKLLNLSRERNDDFGLILTKYGLERVLFRLNKSKYRDFFILKGALLFEVWTKERHRPTRDADLLAKGDNSPERFVRIFKEISAIEVEDDGLRFDPQTVKAERIKEDADYEGVRVTFSAFLKRAQIPIQIDIGFGDVMNARTRRDRIPNTPRSPESSLARLLSGIGSVGKTRSHGQVRHREQPHEGLPRSA
jgi:hypothetical protein